MVITRREFGKAVSMTALGGTIGLTTMGLSCSSVFTDIENYVPIGIAAFQEVLSLIDPTEAALLAPIIQTVKAAFADLDAIVQQYESAPAASKATLLGKISTAISAVMSELQQFWNDANLPDGGLASTIEGVLQIVLSTLAAFLPLLGVAVPVSGAFGAEPYGHKKLARTIPFTAAKRSQKQFKSDVNAVFTKYGYAGHQVY